MKWTEMTSRERDAAMAKLIQGWQEPWYGSGLTPADVIPIPLFTTSHYGAHQAEDEIARRGLQERYIEALDRLVTYERESGWIWFRWGILRATPEQRCEAAWRAMGGE